jgi:hypothetical protein
MTERSEYGNWSVLRELYLEDSYVLEIIEGTRDLTFRMEFVLREGHPRYRAPKPNEQYCYERGELTFQDVSELRWLERNDVLSFDATGERDLGNIDQLYREDGRYTASGDWGRVTFRARNVVAQLRADAGAPPD